VTEEECKHGMFPSSCADCRGLGEVADPLEGLLIDRFLQSAKYPGKCAVDPSHTWSAGDPIGLAVHDNDKGSNFEKLGWVCHSCRTGITYPESRRRG